MSKYQFRQSDIYLPGTDIPVNRLGIDNPEILQLIEAQLLQEAYQGFGAKLQTDTAFDEAFFCGLHRHTFESLYTWAGSYRTEDMVKGGSMFCRAAYLPQESRRIFDKLAAEDFLRSAADNETGFAERLAHYQSEIIALHPFYELNGRITRLFFDLIAMSSGYEPIDYGKALRADAEVDNNYIRASIDCVQRADSRLLQQLIFSGLTKVQTGTRLAQLGGTEPGLEITPRRRS